jgi:hypothetical protein
MSSSNNVAVSYSPTDFFYIMANDVMPTDSSCNDATIGYKIISDASCVPFPDLSQEFLEQKNACEMQVYNEYMNSNIQSGLTTYATTYTSTGERPNHFQFFNFNVISHDYFCNNFCSNTSALGVNAQTVCTQGCASYNVDTGPASSTTSTTTYPVIGYNDIPDFVSKVQQCLSDKDTANNGTTSYSNTYSSDYPKWKQWHDLSMNCYKKELCKNKDNAININNLQNNHLGSDQNYENTKALYMNEYVKTINLSIGVVILVAAIFYSNK